MLFDEFTKQLDWLIQLGYTIITMAQAYEMLKTNQNSIGKVAVLTFDDGYTSWRQVDSILTERKLSGMFFWAGDNLQANSDIATQLVADGFETGNHTAHHMAMGDGQYWPQWAAWNNNKDALSNLNTEINFCAYPFGSHNYLSPMVCKNNDYLACLNFDNKVATAFSSDFDRFTLGRLEMISGQRDDSIDTFANYLQNGDVQY
ncbi:MAG: polysaccharide deacetylase family protein [Lactobacillus sp.]|jgi:peptidoglycan/xylan/chitin deacetylase (PgdA/CDA1 family)|nr:polysaccharide deacetylase family protein [Lactobacillus sp.]